MALVQYPSIELVQIDQFLNKCQFAFNLYKYSINKCFPLLHLLVAYNLLADSEILEHTFTGDLMRELLENK